MEKLKVKTHNVCWAIYTDPEGKIQPLAELHRPQDWGDPRWMYRVYVLEAQIDGVQHKNTCHIWHEGQIPDYQLIEESAGLIVMMMDPGVKPELSGREYLDEDDFWDRSWGKQPPEFIDPDRDEYGDDDSPF